MEGRGAPEKLGALRRQEVYVATGKLEAVEGLGARLMRRTYLHVLLMSLSFFWRLAGQNPKAKLEVGDKMLTDHGAADWKLR